MSRPASVYVKFCMRMRFVGPIIHLVEGHYLNWIKQVQLRRALLKLLCALHNRPLCEIWDILHHTKKINKFWSFKILHSVKIACWNLKLLCWLKSIISDADTMHLIFKVCEIHQKIVHRDFVFFKLVFNFFLIIEYFFEIIFSKKVRIWKNVPRFDFWIFEAFSWVFVLDVPTCEWRQLDNDVHS